MKKHIAQFFKFLEDKEGKPAPLRLKLLDPQTWGKPTKEDLNVKGDLDLSETNIKELPQGLKVDKNLWLDGCTSLEKLPQGLKVGWLLDLTDCTSLEKLPQGLEVGMGLNLTNTPIAQKYSKEEIRKMIERGGKSVKGQIII
jgi:hypothetical protein